MSFVFHECIFTVGILYPRVSLLLVKSSMSEEMWGLYRRIEQSVEKKNLIDPISSLQHQQLRVAIFYYVALVLLFLTISMKVAVFVQSLQQASIFGIGQITWGIGQLATLHESADAWIPPHFKTNNDYRIHACHCPFFFNKMYLIWSLMATSQKRANY